MVDNNNTNIKKLPKDIKVEEYVNDNPKATGYLIL